jgi:hypothetical protein
VTPKEQGIGDKIRLVTHEAAVQLYDLLADRLRQYASLSGDGSAEARGEARTRVEQLLPTDGWLARLLEPTLYEDGGRWRGSGSVSPR